jgi:hypothetical protein
MNTLHKFRFLIVFFVAVLFMYGAVFVYRYGELRHTKALEKVYEGQNLITRLGRLMILPSSSPSIAIVSDSNLLKKRSPFFASAKKGDVVVIYPEKVIVYDPQADKIINVANINQGSGDNTIIPPSTSPTQSK